MANQYYISAGFIPGDSGEDGTGNRYCLSAGLVPDDAVQGGLLPINGSLSSATGMTAGFNGRSGLGGGLDAATVNPFLHQAGRSGLSGDMTANLSPPTLEIFQFSKSEPVSRISMAVQSGPVAFPEPEFGKIEISTVIS